MHGMKGRENITTASVFIKAMGAILARGINADMDAIIKANTDFLKRLGLMMQKKCSAIWQILTEFL